MKKIDLNELRNIQIQILDYVDKFCKENNINYWIDSGTLLGAVRHKGYIPWDDDIDIGMLREDYDKFIKLFNKNQSKKYKLCCYELDNNWHYSFGKVLDTDTVLYEPNEEEGIKLSVFIDVFVYDNAPLNVMKQNIMYKKRDLLLKLNSAQTFKKYTKKEKKKYNIIRYPIYLLLNLFPRGYFLKLNIKNCKKYEKMNTEIIGNFTSVAKIICDKHIFDEFIEVEFEKKMYKAPKRYNEWLKAFYGNYMELPPKEKRVSNHRFVAFYNKKEGR